MGGHPLLLIGGVVVGAIAAIVAVGYSRYRDWERQQQHRQVYRARDEPQGPRTIGTCGICEGDVTNYSGYRMPCGHYAHHTCAVDISTRFRDLIESMQFDWSLVCRDCVKKRVEATKNTGLRNRGADRLHCAECLREFDIGKETIRELNCKHRIHEECWERFQESGLQTCSMCMDGLSS